MTKILTAIKVVLLIAAVSLLAFTAKIRREQRVDVFRVRNLQIVAS